MQNSIVAVIVLYNKYLPDSITYQSIRNLQDQVEILVIDNSDTKNSGSDIFCKRNKIRYISMNENKGLSKAYNCAIDNINGADVLILLDDDTEVTKPYFEQLFRALKRYPDIDIFAPVIRGQDGVSYSPNEFHFLKNKLLSDPNQTVSPNLFNAIAGCLAIRTRVFDYYRYNETLFVDQVDQFFFCEQRALGRSFMKLNVEIKQDFYQRGKTLSADAAWNRLCIRLVDVMRHARLLGGGEFFSDILSAVG